MTASSAWVASALLVLSVLLPGSLPADPAVEEGVARAVAELGHPDLSKRERAARDLEALGRGNPSEVLRVLPREHPDPEVRAVCDETRRKLEVLLRVREALSLAGEDRLLSGWVSGLWENADAAAVQRFVKKGAPRLGSEATVRILGLAVRDLDDPEARRRVAVELGILGGEEAGKILMAMLSDPHPEIETPSEMVPRTERNIGIDPGVRGTAASVLAGMKDTRAEEGIARLLRDPVPPVRKAAIRSLAIAAGPRAVGTITGLFADDDPTVQYAALREVGRLLKAEGTEMDAAARGNLREAIRPFLRDPVDYVRAGAVFAWSRAATDPSEALPDLLAATEDLSRRVQVAAIKELGDLGTGADGRTVSRLATLLDSTDKNVPREAALALGRLAGESWTLQDPDLIEKARASAARRN